MIITIWPVGGGGGASLLVPGGTIATNVRVWRLVFQYSGNYDYDPVSRPVSWLHAYCEDAVCNFLKRKMKMLLHVGSDNFNRP